MRAFTVLTCVGALALGACGGGGAKNAQKPAKPLTPEQQVRATIAVFQQAAQRKDYAKLCRDVLAKPLLDTIKRAQVPCDQALKTGLVGVQNPRLEVQAVSVSGSTATATVRSTAANQAASTDAVRLVREGKAWKVASLGGQSP